MVELATFASREPSGFVFTNRYATGSLTCISYQMPTPIGVPSSEFTIWPRR